MFIRLLLLKINRGRELIETIEKKIKILSSHKHNSIVKILIFENTIRMH